MEDSHVEALLAGSVILAIVLIIGANVVSGAQCRSEAMAAGMKGAEIRETCQL